MSTKIEVAKIIGEYLTCDDSCTRRMRCDTCLEKLAEKIIEYLKKEKEA